MPSIKEQLQNDWKIALKTKDKFTANVLSTAKAAVLLVEKTENKVLADNDVISILAKEIKQRREAIVDFQKGNREDLVEQNNAEIEVLMKYLPQQLSKEEIKQIVKESAEEAGANNIKDMGKVMAIVRPKIIGRADGKLVSALVKEYLNNK